MPVPVIHSLQNDGITTFFSLKNDPLQELNR